MGLFSFFRRKRDKGDFLISSDKPYEVVSDDDEAFMSYRTFTDQLRMGSTREVRLPVKFIYDAENLYQIVLYLPAKDIVAKINEIRANPVQCLVSVWLWFDDDSFIINFPEECDVDFDPAGEIIRCHLILGKTGFDSHANKLREKYSSEGDICRFIIEKLTSHDIVGIEPKILFESHAFDGETIKLFSSTVAPFRKALDSLKASF